MAFARSRACFDEASTAASLGVTPLTTHTILLHPFRFFAASDSSAGANRESSHLDANAFASPKGRPSTGAAAHDFPIALHSPHAAAGPLALPHAPPPPLDDPLLPPLHSAEEPEPVKEENHLEADFARERRFRLISRLLSSPKMREAVDTLKKHSKLITVRSSVQTCFVE